MLSNGWRVEVVHGRKIPPGRAASLCQPRTLLVMRYGAAHEGPCRYLGQAELARLGAVAVHADEDGLRLVPARDPARRRLWSRGGA